MPTYIIMYNSRTRESEHQERPSVLEAGIKAFEKIGGKVLGAWYLLGEMTSWSSGKSRAEELGVRQHPGSVRAGKRDGPPPSGPSLPRNSPASSRRFHSPPATRDPATAACAVRAWAYCAIVRSRRGRKENVCMCLKVCLTSLTVAAAGGPSAAGQPPKLRRA